MAFSTPMLKYLKNPPGPIRNYPLPPNIKIKVARDSFVLVPEDF